MINFDTTYSSIWIIWTLLIVVYEYLMKILCDFMWLLIVVYQFLILLNDAIVTT